jgi:outer membrane lipopolysaccharide assembly protein LptE/RlpB
VLRRDLRFDANEVLGKSSEEERLRQDMLDSAAQQILRRVPKVTGS